MLGVTAKAALMNNRFRVSSSLERRLRDLGLSPAAILAQAGLPLGLFNGERILLTTEEFFALYRGIAEASGDPGVGLKLGTENRIELYDPIKIAALSTRSLRSAIERLSRYKQLTCPEKIDMVERGEECAVRFRWLLAKQEEPGVLVDVCFAWIATIAERGADRRVRPKRVEFERPEAFRSIYEKYFGCPVKFNATRNALVFTRVDADVPFLTYNPDLLAAIAPQLEAELTQQMAAEDLREQVKGTLKGLLAGQRPRIQDIARELRMSARTLQRRLAEHGATFQSLAEEARRELAHHYLLHSSLELNETAYLLGYEDANSFFRAFHKWEGTSPGQWKSSHANLS
jgi:AraC-like DNA-binding protein